MSGINSNDVSFAEAFRIALNNFISEINICLPGKIVKVLDFKKRKISVQPEIKKVFLDGVQLDPPIIENVPLLYYGMSEGILNFPIKSEDKVLILFSQRSLDNWLSKGSLTTPGTNRKFDMSDAIAVPCLQPFNSSHSLIDNNQNTELIFDNKKIKFIKGGVLQIDTAENKITINNSVEDLAQLISDLIDTIINIVTVGSPPTHTLDPATIAAFNVIKTRFSNLLEVS
jgi:hypothetical protein